MDTHISIDSNNVLCAETEAAKKKRNIQDEGKYSTATQVFYIFEYKSPDLHAAPLAIFSVDISIPDWFL